MDLYSFDISCDNTLPIGKGHYTISNVIKHGGDIASLSDDIEDRDYQKFVTCDVRAYIYNGGYVIYNKIYNSNIINMRIGVNMDYDISRNHHYKHIPILRTKGLQTVLQKAIREQKINGLFS